MKIYECDYCLEEYINKADARRCATGHQQPNPVAVFEYDEPAASKPMQLYECSCGCGAKFTSKSGWQACVLSHIKTIVVTEAPSARARRTPAVEDFAAIGQRLRELQPVMEGYNDIAPKPTAASQGGPAGGAVNYLPDDLSDIDKRPNSQPGSKYLTYDERRRVAEAYKCTLGVLCGKENTKACLINRKCMH